MSKKNKTASLPLTPEQVIKKRLRRIADREDVTSFFTRLIWMAILLALLLGYLFGITPMKNDDMLPKISSGDVLLYYRLPQKLRNSDILVFEKDGKQYVGRIVAKGGDSVEITEESTVKVNNSTVIETDIYFKTPIYGDQIQYPVTLKEDQYFILCDYRDGAKDSRFYGPVNQSEIKGKVISILRRSSL